MASENLTDVPIPFQNVLEANSNLISKPPQNYEKFMASLPRRSLHHKCCRLYQRFWIPEYYLRGVLAMKEHFKLRSSDIFIASYPKSGTTWLKALIFATMTRTSYSFDQNPLLTYNPHQCVAYMDEQFSLGKMPILEAIPSPRLLSTHIPYSLLPTSITDSDARIIYIWRDPKDVIVSLWHFARKFYKGVLSFLLFPSFAKYFESFCEGSSIFGPIWDHIIGYWQAAKRKPEKILFLKYENVLADPVKYAKVIAKFIGHPYSEAEEKEGMIDKVVDLCSFRKLKDLEVNKDGSGLIQGINVSYAFYFRKGMIGDWKNYMTREMAERLDKIVEEKFKEYEMEIPS